ncbi:aldehyde dehydrogenase family protein [Arthrobacter sp. NPDC080031]|uniref:aldehyde dehydrogenase family protein n=1 Tax=Arthrobacter sp. NPDC080031 TaxID=3155918 RepID=UPI00345041D8
MTFTTINPATGEQLASFETISDAEVESLLSTADYAFKDWRARPAAERAAILKNAAAYLRDQLDEYAGYITLEMGKLHWEAEAEVQLAASILDYYADHVDAFLEPAPIVDSPGAYVQPHPIGPILAIEPWNFPYYQVARVVGPQLAVGNVVLLKHAENVPQCAMAFARALEQAGVPAGVFTNLFVTHEQSAQIIADPRVAGVTITGSPRAGAAVAAAAGRHLKKVVAELGGSDPLIVLEDADISNAVFGAVFGRMFNNGQCCVGSKRLIVVGKDRGEQVITAIAEAFGALTPADPAVPVGALINLGPLASERALGILLEQIKTAAANGAQIRAGGKRVDRPGFYLEPTILTEITNDNPAYSEEFFGPVLAAYVVDTEEEAIALANDTPWGLGASVFTGDSARGQRIATELDSGMVFINQPAWTSAEMPFGGTKASGFGRELGKAGFGEFVNHKLVNVAKVGSGPWGPSPEV